MGRTRAIKTVLDRGKTKAIKQLTVGTDKSAGRNSAGRITIYHRGGGSKRLQRVLDLKRDNPSTGIVERIEYDPNRSSKIALVRWITGHDQLLRRQTPKESKGSTGFVPPREILRTRAKIGDTFPFKLLPGKITKGINFPSYSSATSLSKGFLPRALVAGAKPAIYSARTSGERKKGTVALREVRRAADSGLKAALNFSSSGPPRRKEPKKTKVKVNKDDSDSKSFQADRALVSYILAGRELEAGKTVMNCGPEGVEVAMDSSAQYALDPQNQAGNCIPLADMRLGTWIHSIEIFPGHGPQLTRAAGTFAKIIKKNEQQCLVRLPSGAEKVLDSRCRATIGTVSNPNHGARKLRKAGQSRWLGRRPVVRGVAMNPVDHPHGGGEGRTKGGRPSVTPWGKPTKAGYKTRNPKKTETKFKAF
uniref:60S ribosomal protein L2, mitochondrial n=1 Tax=Araucaria cunninghamii TaxID=56994 RepID=A0A0D6QRS0_ARACU